MQQRRINLKEMQMFYSCEEQLIDFKLQMLRGTFLLTMGSIHWKVKMKSISLLIV
jgi:hypothetical protein